MALTCRSILQRLAPANAVTKHAFVSTTMGTREPLASDNRHFGQYQGKQNRKCSRKRDAVSIVAHHD